MPRLDYLPEERRCWGTVLHELKKLYPGHACREFLQNLDRYNFREEEVPQLEDISQVLRCSRQWPPNDRLKKHHSSLSRFQCFGGSQLSLPDHRIVGSLIVDSSIK